MNIGLFTDTYSPEINGVATSVLMLRENLEKQGHNLFIFTITCPDAPPEERHVYRVPSVPFSIRRLGTFINPGLKKDIKCLELDIVHTHTEFSLGFFGRSIARSLHIPLVHTMHTLYEDYTHYIIKSKRLEPLLKAAARKLTASFCNSADRIIVPTNKVRDLLLAYGVHKNIAVIPTGISLDQFAAADVAKSSAIRQQLNIGENDRVIINIGRISAEKNLDEIFHTMKNYLRRRDGVKLLLVGDGPAEEGLKRLAAELAIDDFVIFAGARPWNEIGLYYGLGDVFVGASQSETQGLTYIEALASGLPIVARADRCLEEILVDGENGYAWHSGDELQAALDRVLFDRPERERLSLGALRTAASFSAAGYGEAVASLYQTLVIRHAHR